MPSRRAISGVLTSVGAPSSRISPALRGMAPARIFISVDLPAPFSPTMACTSPPSAEKSTPRKASVPSKLLWMPRILSMADPQPGPRSRRRERVVDNDRLLIGHLLQGIVDALAPVPAHLDPAERQRLHPQRR